MVLEDQFPFAFTIPSLSILLPPQVRVFHMFVSQDVPKRQPVILLVDSIYAICVVAVPLNGRLIRQRQSRCLVSLASGAPGFNLVPRAFPFLIGRPPN